MPALALALWSLWFPSDLTGQATGTDTITGRVTDGASGQPIPAAQISIVGTTTGTITTDEGRYTLRGVPAGSITLRMLRVGYSECRQTVVLAAGQTVTLDLSLTSVPASLSAVVSTATGAQRRLEVGNAIAQVTASELVETRPITNMGDLLNGRAAGVTVFGDTQPGAGIRIRGQSSLSLSNDPIYIIDGIRMEGTTGSSSVSVGGTTPSRIGDLNPEEIETIEIVRSVRRDALRHRRRQRRRRDHHEEGCRRPTAVDVLHGAVGRERPQQLPHRLHRLAHRHHGGHAHHHDKRPRRLLHALPGRGQRAFAHAHAAQPRCAHQDHHTRQCQHHAVAQGRCGHQRRVRLV